MKHAFPSSRKGPPFLPGLRVWRLAVLVLCSLWVKPCGGGSLAATRRKPTQEASFLHTRPLGFNTREHLARPCGRESAASLSRVKCASRESQVAASSSKKPHKSRRALQDVGKAIRAEDLEEALELLSAHLPASHDCPPESPVCEDSNREALLSASSGVFNLCARQGNLDAARRLLKLLHLRGVLFPLCGEVVASFVAAAASSGDGASTAAMIRLSLLEGKPILSRALSAVLERLFVCRGLGWTAVENAGVPLLLQRQSDLCNAHLFLRALFNDAAALDLRLRKIRAEEQAPLEALLRKTCDANSNSNSNSQTPGGAAPGEEELLGRLIAVYRRQVQLLTLVDGAVRRASALAAFALEGRELLPLSATVSAVERLQAARNSKVNVAQVAAPRGVSSAEEVEQKTARSSGADESLPECSSCRSLLGCVGLRANERRLLRLGVLKLAALNGPKQLQRLLHFEGLLRQLQNGQQRSNREGGGAARKNRPRGFTAVLDAANIAYNRQNREGGHFSYDQVERVRRALLARGERPLVILPAVYFWGLRRKTGGADSRVSSSETPRLRPPSPRPSSRRAAIEGPAKSSALCRLGACADCWGEVFIPNQSRRNASEREEASPEAEASGCDFPASSKTPPTRQTALRGEVQKLTCADRALLRLWQKEKCLFVCGSGAHDDHYHLLATLSGESVTAAAPPSGEEKRRQKSEIPDSAENAAFSEEGADEEATTAPSLCRSLAPLPPLSRMLQETHKPAASPSSSLTASLHFGHAPTAEDEATVSAFREVLRTRQFDSREAWMKVLLEGWPASAAREPQQPQQHHHHPQEHLHQQQVHARSDSTAAASEGAATSAAEDSSAEESLNRPRRRAPQSGEEEEDLSSDGTFIPLPLLTNDRFRDHRLVSQLRVPFSHWRQLALLPFSFFENPLSTRRPLSRGRNFTPPRKVWSSDVAFFGEEENAVAEEQRKLRGSFTAAADAQSLPQDFDWSSSSSASSDKREKRKRRDSAPRGAELTSAGDAEDGSEALRIKGFFASAPSSERGGGVASSASLPREASFSWRRFSTGDSDDPLLPSDQPSSVLFLGSRRAVTPRAQAPLTWGLGGANLSEGATQHQRVVFHFPLEVTESECAGEGTPARHYSASEFETGLETGESSRPPPLDLLTAMDNPEAWRQQEALEGRRLWLCVDNASLLRERANLLRRIETLEKRLDSLRGGRRRGAAEKASNSSQP